MDRLCNGNLWSTPNLKCSSKHHSIDSSKLSKTDRYYFCNDQCPNNIHHMSQEETMEWHSTDSLCHLVHLMLLRRCPKISPRYARKQAMLGNVMHIPGLSCFRNLLVQQPLYFLHWCRTAERMESMPSLAQGDAEESRNGGDVTVWPSC